MLKKRILSMLIIFSVIFATLPAKAIEYKKSGDKNVAEAFLNDKSTISGFSVVEMGTDKEPSINYKGNLPCWYLDVTKGERASTINLILDDEFRSDRFDGTEYDLEIDYFDEGNAFCRVNYGDKNGKERIAYDIYSHNELAWKTVKVTLQDAFFNKNINGGYDISLTIVAKDRRAALKSEKSVGIKRIKLTKREKVNPVFITATTDELGNTFGYAQEKKIVHNKIENVSEFPLDATLNFKLVSKVGYEAFTENIDIKLEPGEIKDLDLDISEVDYCSIYDYKVNVKSKDGKINSDITPTGIAVVKTDPDGVRNDDTTIQLIMDNDYMQGFASDQDVRNVIGMVDKANFAGIRNGLTGYVYYDYPTQSFFLEESYYAVVADELRKRNMKFLPILPWQLTHVNRTWNTPEITEAELDELRLHDTKIVEMIGDLADWYEVGNEPNHTSFNTRGVNGSEYAKSVKVAYEVVKELDPTAKVGGMSLTGIRNSPEYNGWPMFMEAMSVDVNEYLDAVSLHPYLWNQAPEGGRDQVVDILPYKEEFVKAGSPEPYIMNTEFGYSKVSVGGGYTGEIVQGKWNVRMYLKLKQAGVSDHLTFHTFLDTYGRVEPYREDVFGIVGPYGSSAMIHGVPCFPQEAYVMMTAMNYAMADTVPTGDLTPADKSVYINKFRSGKFNADVLTLHTMDIDKTINIDLGCDSVRLIDSRGNEQILNAVDGVFTIPVSGRAIYLVGNFSKTELVDKKAFEYAETNLLAAENDLFTISFKKNVPYDYTVEVKTSSIADVLENNGFDESGVAKIVMRNKAPIGQSYTVRINIKDGEKLVNSSEITVESKAVVDIGMDFSMQGEDLNRWIATARIRNTSSSNALRGYIKFKSPDFVENMSQINVGVIPKNRTAEVQIPLPKITRKGEYAFEYEFVAENGAVYPFAIKKDFTLATYADVKPKIDGVLEQGEWEINTAMYADSIEQIKLIEGWAGPDDLSGRAVVEWDEDNLYIMFDVTDDVYHLAEHGFNNWKGDGLQVGIFYGSQEHVAIGQASTTFHELGIARSSEGPHVYRTLSQEDYYESDFVEAEVEVKNEGKRTIYECKIPWKNVLLPDQQPQAGEKLGFSFLINDNDGAGRRGWIEYASGIGEAKNTTLFTYLTLLK